MSKPRVLIGSDFSEHSSVALQVGKVWTKKLNAELHVIHVNNSKDSTDALAHADDSKGVVSGLVENLRHNLEDKLKKQLDEQGMHQKDIHNHVSFGKKNEVLHEEVKKLNAKLLVLGCLGQSGFEGLFLGGTTERAIRSVPCPILAVRDEACAKPKFICWAVDLSQRSDFVFEWLKIVAEVFSPKVEMMMVESDQTRTLEDYPKLKFYYEQLKLSGIDVSIKLIPPTRGSIEKSLEKNISEGDYDLIVMGTEAKRGLRRFLLGSVAEYLTHHVRRSFLIIKHPQD
jgi:nucleotide-binding universal stress UspA family protein